MRASVSRVKIASVVLGLVLALAGCGPDDGPPVVAAPRPEDMETYNEDNYRCTQESQTTWSGGGTGLAGIAFAARRASVGAGPANKKYKLCMDAAGWTGVEVPRPAARSLPGPYDSKPIQYFRGA